MTRRQEQRIDRLAEKDAPELIRTGREIDRTFATKEQAELYMQRVRHHVQILQRTAQIQAKAER